MSYYWIFLWMMLAFVSIRVLDWAFRHLVLFPLERRAGGRVGRVGGPGQFTHDGWDAERWKVMQDAEFDLHLVALDIALEPIPRDLGVVPGVVRSSGSILALAEKADAYRRAVPPELRKNMRAMAAYRATLREELGPRDSATEVV